MTSPEKWNTMNSCPEFPHLCPLSQVSTALEIRIGGQVGDRKNPGTSSPCQERTTFCPEQWKAHAEKARPAWPGKEGGT